jgi:hypothetical protein
MGRQPRQDRAAGVAGEIVGDQVEVFLRMGLIECLQQRQIACRVACGRDLGERLAIPDAQRAIDPDLVASAVVEQRNLDAMPIWRPARRWRDVPGGHGAEFVDTQDRRAFGRVGVERDDRRSVGTKSGSVLVAHSRVRRQRTPS